MTITPITNSVISTEPSKEFFWQATARLPYEQITRIAEGMIVRVELEGYPSRIYGYVNGSITHINKSVLKQSDQNYFTITITLSTFQSAVEIQSEMNGNAFIFLSNESILKHILKGFL